MYKTIRHGENSLQYTILPQNDDFRIDSKISNINNSGGSHKTRRGKKRSFFAYLGLIFVCTVIIGAVLIPYLVSTECLPNPSNWFLKAKVALSTNNKSTSNNYNNNSTVFQTNNNNYNSKHVNEDDKINNNNNKDIITNTNNKINSKYNNNNNKTESTIIKAYLDRNQKNVDESTNVPTTTVKKDTIITATSSSLSNMDNTLSMIRPTLNSRKKVLNSLRYNVLPPTEEGITSDNHEDDKIIMKIVTKFPENNSNKVSIAPIKKETHNNLPVQPFTKAPPELTLHHSIKIMSTKKPIILPVLAKSNSVIRSHWPFIDPSTYFQWTGYKSEDSVLLPAILGLALIGLILIVSLCLVVRHKNKIFSSVRNRNRNATEEAGEDNTTLLTTASDDD